MSAQRLMFSPRIGRTEGETATTSSCITMMATATCAKEKNRKTERQKDTEVLFRVALHDVDNDSKFSGD